MLGLSGLGLLESLLLGCSDLRLPRSLLVALSRHQLLLLINCGTCSCSDQLVQHRVIQGL
jgi:hypothetical protein